MSQKSFEDSPVEKKGKQEDKDLIEKGIHASGPDKKLMYGMVQFYEDILATLPNTFIAVFNDSGKFIEVWGNFSIKDDIGIDPMEFKSKLVSDIFSPEVSTQLLNGIQSIRKTGKPITLRIQSKFPKGTYWFEVKFTALQQSNDKRTIIVSHFQNITRIIQAQDSLKEEKKNPSISNQIPEGVIIANNKGIVTSVNENLQHLSGYEASDFTGRKLSKLPILKPKDVPIFEAVLEAVYDGRLQESFEIHWKNSNGQINWSEIQASLITRLNKITGIQVIFKDITERKLIEKDLMKSKQAYKVIIENAQKPFLLYRTVIFGSATHDCLRW